VKYTFRFDYTRVSVLKQRRNQDQLQDEQSKHISRQKGYRNVEHTPRLSLASCVFVHSHLPPTLRHYGMWWLSERLGHHRVPTNNKQHPEERCLAWSNIPAPLNQYALVVNHIPQPSWKICSKGGWLCLWWRTFWRKRSHQMKGNQESADCRKWCRELQVTTIRKQYGVDVHLLVLTRIVAPHQPKTQQQASPCVHDEDTPRAA
jgi:hypothetical protein